jgi:hypothetical protein
MSLFRAVPLHVHSALEVVAAPILFVAPFALGFSLAAGAASLALGVLVIGSALSLYGDDGRGSVPIQAHAGFDYLLGAATLAVAAIAFVAGDYVAGIFMLGFGSAHLALTASTRFSRPLGA